MATSGELANALLAPDDGSGHEGEAHESEPWRPFPVEALPDGVREFVTAVAKATTTDPSFAALACIVTLAGCVGNRIGVCKKRGWIEASVLWGAIVAPSSAIKSPVLREVTKPIMAIFKEQHAEYKKRRAAHEIEKEHYKVQYTTWRNAQKEGLATDPPIPPEAPTEQRVVIQDATTEKIGKLLEENPAGLFAVFGELAGWAGAFDRYAAGGKGSDRSAWLQMYDAAPWLIDRKCEGQSILIERAAVSVLGCIQLKTLRRVFAAADREAGLLGRVLCVNPPYVPQLYTDDEIGEDVATTWEGIIRGTLGVETLKDDDGSIKTRYLGLSHEAAGLWVEWHDRLAVELTAIEDEDLQAHWGKFKGMSLRIALVFAVVEGLKQHHIQNVDAESMRRALVVMEWFKGESARLYAQISIGSGSEREDDLLRRLEDWITKRPRKVCTVRDLVRHLARYRNKPDEARKDLQGLVDDGRGRWVHPRPGERGGRPAEFFQLTDTTPTDSTDIDETPRGVIKNAGCVGVGSVGAACDESSVSARDEAGAPVDDPSPGPSDAEAEAGAAELVEDREGLL